MSSLVLAGVKTFGSTLLNTAGNVALSYANQAINNLFYDNSREGPRLQTFHIQSSRDGAPMARVFGKVRLAGQVIWAAKLKEHTSETRSGGKGGGASSREYSYTLSFAVGLCEGEILAVDRIWANGAPLATGSLSMRVYRGGEDQTPDPLISEIERLQAPAFRGTAYVVFEDMPLDSFGNRLPQLNFEVTRIPPRSDDGPRLEDLVKSVNLIPGTGEFAYGSSIVERRMGPGQSVPENIHNLTGQADIDTSLDQLQTQLPNCQNVTLIVSWFGDDLRAGACHLRPGVENRDKTTSPYEWSVAGQTRETAYEISKINGRAVYGGTPSDRCVIEAIQNLQARGLGVCVHPFILMDIPDGNSLMSPYGGAAQPAFPWRGRITCSPAAGQPGTVDKTLAAETQIQSFFGTCQPSDFQIIDDQVVYSGPQEYSYRRMVLHMAFLAKAAGGVERFLIGSELRGLTTVRGSSADPYPAVSALMTLASDVKAVLGAGTKLSYAADWSEYFGHHPDDGTGDVLFHLDPLWAHSAIDAIGVDAYIPLSDWRDGDSHLDAGQYDNIYELAYLQANIQGAEGYDWYYASPADREAQNRSSITDGLAGKPWVFRYKDFYNWWSNPHFDRVNGVEVSNPTPFVPQSKPFWFCEIGCPAIDKGANQPNVFYDPKSSESFVPYFSDGTRNDLIQRRYIEAFLDYYNKPVHNPVSTQYLAPMIDQAWSSIWCWDTRPFPDFPARMDVWADGDNWTTGHWLNGRIGLVALADIIFDLALDSGLENVDVSAVSGMVSGYMVERPMSGRASLSPLLDIYGVDLVETAQGLVFSSSRDTVAPISLSENDLIMNAEGETVVLERLDASDQPLDVRINYIDQQHDYQGASVYARDQFAQSVHILDITAPLVLDKTIGKTLAETRLKNRIIQSQTLRFTVPISAYALECADIITFDSLPGHWQIIELDGQGERRVTARRMDGGETVFIAGGTDPVPPDPPIVVPWISEPAPHVLDLPNILRDVSREGPLVGVELSPWSPGLVESGVGTSVRLIRPVAVGQILHDLPAGPVAVFDHQSLDIHLPGVQLASLPTQVFLNGGNMFALETAGGFEIFQAQFADLTGDETYRLSGLLRGLGGSDHLMMPSAPSGANLYYLSRGWQSLALSPAIRNADIELTFSTDGRTNTQMVSFPYLAEHLRPVSPVSLAAKIEGADIRLSWIRRSRIGGDDWNAPDIVLGETIERYRVEVLENGAPIWSEDISENMCTVPISDLEPFLGPGFSQITFRVAQISEIFGPGTPRTAVILL